MLDRLIRPGRDVNFRRLAVLGLHSNVSSVPKNASGFERQRGWFSRRRSGADVFESQRKLAVSEICRSHRYVDLIRNEVRENAKSKVGRFTSASRRRFRRSAGDTRLGDWMRLKSSSNSRSCRDDVYRLASSNDILAISGQCVFLLFLLSSS